MSRQSLHGLKPRVHWEFLQVTAIYPKSYYFLGLREGRQTSDNIDDTTQTCFDSVGSVAQYHQNDMLKTSMLELDQSPLIIKTFVQYPIVERKQGKDNPIIESKLICRWCVSLKPGVKGWT
eukprot:453409-Amphidinium_carterae.1